MQHGKPVSRILFFAGLATMVTGCNVQVTQLDEWFEGFGRTAESQSPEGFACPKTLKRCQAALRNHRDYSFSFDLLSLDGERLQSEQFRGKVLIVDLWGTWCPPCRKEIPHFVDLQDRYGEQGLAIVGLNYERSQNEQAAVRTIRSFTRRQPINYPLALGTDKVKQQVPQMNCFPTTLFLDRHGIVRATVRGAQSLVFLETMAKLLLAEPAGDDSQPQMVGYSARQEPATVNVASDSEAMAGGKPGATVQQKGQASPPVSPPQMNHRDFPRIRENPYAW